MIKSYTDITKIEKLKEIILIKSGYNFLNKLFIRFIMMGRV